MRIHDPRAWLALLLLSSFAPSLAVAQQAGMRFAPVLTVEGGPSFMTANWRDPVGASRAEGVVGGAGASLRLGMLRVAARYDGGDLHSDGRRQPFARGALELRF